MEAAMPFVHPLLSTRRAARVRLFPPALLVTFGAAAILALVAVPATASASREDDGRSGSNSDAVIAWNENAGEAARAACISPIDNPLHESRAYAMTHVAIHDALNAIDRRSQPYAFDGEARRRASPDAAVAAAARDVLVALLSQIPAPFPPACGAAGVASVEADYMVALGAIPDGRAKTRGIEVGKSAAAAILALRAADGSNTPLGVPGYPQGALPGVYRFTPGFPFAFAPGWADVTPFVLKDSSEFRPGPPDAVTGRKYAADFKEVKRLGGDGVTTPSARTAEQTEIARFWVESAPLQWNRIARAVSAGRGLDLWEQARLFGLLNLGLADGYIASFDTKYHYNYWRPVTAIRNADADGNPRTSGAPKWTPLVPTPPIPDYDSAHSVEGGIAAKVLKRFFGTDQISFETCSLSLPTGTCDDESPVRRRYTSFSQAAHENGVSRILVGFHFRKAVEEGIEHGRTIGNLTIDHFLRPAGGHHNRGGHGSWTARLSHRLRAFPGKNGKIAFESDRHGGDPDIWTMRPRGSRLVNLTADSEGSDQLANWRADGRKIVFMSDRETSSNPTPPGLEGPDYEIFVMNADGSNPTQITFNELDDEDPAWSPTGNRIVFQRDLIPARGEVDYDILTMRADGTGEENLTNSPGLLEHEPSWSPNGGKIAFARAPNTDSNNDIYKMSPDGSKVQRLTINALDNEFPNWSPDGRRIAFNSNRDDRRKEENFEVYTMRAGGGHVTRLTFNKAGDGLPAWSPNGRKIAFASDRAGAADIHTMRANGHDQVNRTNKKSFDYAPDWGAARR
jgi:Tol biopolymer transport system component